jgi:hypothetical protein
MAIANIAGNRYGRLTAMTFSHTHQSNAYWVFLCDCGVKITVSANSVKRGNTQSCGCHRKEVSAKINLTHGQARDGQQSRLYQIWAQMKRRCDLPTHEAYPDYGGRGIRVCREWSNSFEAFEDWAINSGYSDDLTIDRRNNDGNYEPGNCRWLDRKGQANNRRSSRIVSYLDMDMTLAELSNCSGIGESTLADRLDRGMSVDRAVNKRRYSR